MTFGGTLVGIHWRKETDTTFRRNLFCQNKTSRLFGANVEKPLND
jgi:hypothetical protein